MHASQHVGSTRPSTSETCLLLTQIVLLARLLSSRPTYADEIDAMKDAYLSYKGDLINVFVDISKPNITSRICDAFEGKRAFPDTPPCRNTHCKYLPDESYRAGCLETLTLVTEGVIPTIRGFDVNSDIKFGEDLVCVTAPDCQTVGRPLIDRPETAPAQASTSNVLQDSTEKFTLAR